LERIVHDLEDGGLGLEDSLGRYEQGVGLLRNCYTQLRQAEQRIQLLVGVGPDDQPVVQSFQHSATADQGKPVARKRSKPASEDELPL
jgi:exodeoxyribonuclease VII small subunit